MAKNNGVVGIDEAGRGPALGPLVIGMVRWTDPDLPDDIRLRDSKKLTKNQRNETYESIIDTVDHQILAIPAWVITSRPESLPMIEAEVISSSLNNLDGVEIYCDRLSAGDVIHNHIRENHPERQFVFETGADDRYPAVSAASILAKVTRDRIMDVRREEWGKIGSGYPSDSSTRTWMEDHYKDRRDWPSFVRTEWGTTRTIEQRIDQTEIF